MTRRANFCLLPDKYPTNTWKKAVNALSRAPQFLRGRKLRKVQRCACRAQLRLRGRTTAKCKELGFRR